MQMSPSDLQSSRMRQGKEWEDGGWCDVTHSLYSRSRQLLWKEGELVIRLSARRTAAYVCPPCQQMHTRVYICWLMAE